jgi:hypothetical protein
MRVRHLELDLAERVALARTLANALAGLGLHVT